MRRPNLLIWPATGSSFDAHPSDRSPGSSSAASSSGTRCSTSPTGACRGTYFMSLAHPIIAVTGSSGAGTSTVRTAFQHIFDRLHLKAVYVEGDSFHRHDRDEMKNMVQRALVRGENFSHYGQDANHLDRLEALFRDYSAHGTG